MGGRKTTAHGGLFGSHLPDDIIRVNVVKRILYVRHGESTANINGVAGVSDAQLTERGAEQAKVTGQHLKNEGVVTIACSPFIRARQTAEIIAQELGYPVYEIVTIDELQERYLGEFEGTTGTPPGFFLNSDNEGGIESRQHMIGRAMKAIAKLKVIHRGAWWYDTCYRSWANRLLCYASCKRPHSF